MSRAASCPICPPTLGSPGPSSALNHYKESSINPSAFKKLIKSGMPLPWLELASAGRGGRVHPLLLSSGTAGNLTWEVLIESQRLEQLALVASQVRQ